MIAMLAEGGRASYDERGPAGAGDPLLLVHGFPHGRGLWAPTVAAFDALGARRRCVAPDLPGFGESTWPAPPSVDAYADALAAVLDTLGIARAAVAGLSLGGYVALALWRRHAARVSALVLADTRAEADDDAARARRGEHVALVRQGGLAALAEAQLDGSLGATTREQRPEVVRSFRELMAHAGPSDGVVGAIGALRDRPDATATLATIAVPTLVLVGAEDVLTRPSEMRRMHERIPRSRFVVLPEAGHVSCWEQPAAFAAAVDEFLRAE